MRHLLASLLPVLTFVSCSTPAPATGVGGELQGPIRILVGFAPGGGYDLHARVLASHLGRHLPGQPAIVVQNMPGAGGLVAANHLAQRVEPDGLTLELVGLSTILAQLLNQPGVQFDVRDFGTIGSLTSDDADVCAITTASGIDLARWRGGGVAPRLGFTASGSANHVRATLLAASLDLPFRAVVGYAGMADVRMAMGSGEIDGTCVGVLSYRATFAASADNVIVLKSNDTVMRGLDDVASAAALVTSEAGRSLLAVLEQLRTLDRYVVTPPGTRADLLAILRRAFDDTMADTAFRKDAAAAGLDIRPIAGSDVTPRVDAVLGLPAETRQRIAALVGSQARRP